MSEKQYRDAYFIINRDEDCAVVFNNDLIKLSDVDAFNEDGDYVGEVSPYIEDVYQAAQLLKQFREDGILPVNSTTPLILNPADLEDHNITQAVVAFSTSDLVVCYYGVLEVSPDEIVPAEAVLEECRCSQCNEPLYPINDEDRYVLTEAGRELCEALFPELVKEEIEVINDEREESKLMDNLFGNLGFGKIRGDRFKLSMNGIAVAQNSGKYVVYNKDNNEFVDVSNMLFDIKDALFLLPAVEVNAGDTVLHEGKPYFVVDTTNEIKAVDYETCTQTVLIPKSTMFGIKYFQKVFSMFGDNFAAAGDLFSNPMMLMALMEGKNSDLTQMMLFSSLSNGDLGSNPMALAMMLNGDKSNDSLSTIALMSMFNGGTNPFAPKKKEAKKTNADK